MSENARAWLPDNAPVPPALDTRLSGVVGEWAQAWFAHGHSVLLPLKRNFPGRLNWRVTGNGLMLGLTADTARRLGQRILDLGDGPGVEADRAVLEELAEEAIADLTTRLATVTSTPRDAAWRAALEPACVVAALDDRSLPIVAVGLTPDLFARLARAALPVAPLPKLGPGSEALARQRLRVSAAAGRCRITVAELSMLAVGDVLVLDSELSKPLPLAVDGHRLARGTCAVVPGAKPGLLVEQAPA